MHEKVTKEEADKKAAEAAESGANEPAATGERARLPLDVAV